MKCRSCSNEIDHLWNDMWELCDKCGYRYNIETQRSPDDNCKIESDNLCKYCKNDRGKGVTCRLAVIDATCFNGKEVYCFGIK